MPNTLLPRKRRAAAPAPSPARGRAVQLAPSILSADFKDLRSALVRCRQSDCHWIHLDVMDGHFVPNVSFGPGVIESIRSVSKDFYFDVHLMVTDPRMYIKPLLQANVQCVTFHIEAAREDTSNLLRHLKRQGLQAGLALRPRTPVAEIIPHFQHADLVLVMTVEPGFGGQKLIPATLNKVRELVHLREKYGLSFMIQVDGGINADTAPLAVAAGSDVLVAGSSVFKGGKVKENVKVLRKSLAQIR